MKKQGFLIAVSLLVMLLAGCKQNKQAPVIAPTDGKEALENDSTVYGTCGEGSAMHTLELLTDNGDTLDYVFSGDDEAASPVAGGLFGGDRMAVTGYKNSDGEMVATKIINLTTLLGKWTSLDKNFEILDGGKVKSYAKAEENPWTSWKILNGRLLLNKDTFDIDELGADSLYLENKTGIYTFKRQK